MRHLVSAVITVLLAGVLPAQSPDRARDAARVRTAADMFFRAVADERWRDAAAMIDTQVVRRFALRRAAFTATSAPSRELTVEDFMRDDPNKPRAVAEYELKRYRERTAVLDDPVSYEFARVSSATELTQLSALDASARYLEAQDDRARRRETLRRKGCPVDSATLGGVYRLRRILGAVADSDTSAYVLHNEFDDTVSGPDLLYTPGPQVMQLRKRRGTWLIMPRSDLLRRPNTAWTDVSCPRPLRPPSE